MVSKILKKIAFSLVALVFLLFSACNEDGLSETIDGDYSGDIKLSSEGSGVETPGGSDQGNGNNTGLITAGEWNDLENWNFWKNILNENEYFKNVSYWEFYTLNRISIQVKNNATPIINAKVELKLNNELVWQSMTDNFGKTELFVDLFKDSNISNFNGFKLFINGIENATPLKFVEDGIVEVELNSAQNNSSNKVEIAFIVDATGSMGDELEFLKDDLKDVIQRSEQSNSELDIFTGTVFYRDRDDDYLVKSSGFTNNISSTLNFINQQSANGGGDFPEAVDSALDEALTELQWSLNSRTRIAFLLLDAPPHYNVQILDKLHSLITKYAEKGIKLIPITASGIDKETEFLMRFFAVSTNGTYVFITNDSGIGNEHLEASVGDYQVENLNNLLVRLIDKYSTN